MSTNSADRIGGWLLAPLAWLLVALLSASLAMFLYAGALLSPGTFSALRNLSLTLLVQWIVSFLFTIALWYYTFWLTIAFFKRRKAVPKHYIIWLLISVLLALKTFAFSPVSDTVALRQLLFPLLAAAIFAPYFRRSGRVKRTFINP